MRRHEVNAGTRNIRGSNEPHSNKRHCNPGIESSENASNAAVQSAATMAEVIFNELAAK